MQCALCGGELRQEIISHSERWDGVLYSFEDVPAWVCESCGDVSFDGKIVEQMEAIIQGIRSSDATNRRESSFSARRLPRLER